MRDQQTLETTIGHQKRRTLNKQVLGSFTLIGSYRSELLGSVEARS